MDIDNPSIVKYRCKNPLLTPEKWYDERGFVPNVIFPCSTIHDSATGRISLYYGAADTYVCLVVTTDFYSLPVVEIGTHNLKRWGTSLRLVITIKKLASDRVI